MLGEVRHMQLCLQAELSPAKVLTVFRHQRGTVPWQQAALLGLGSRADTVDGAESRRLVAATQLGVCAFWLFAGSGVFFASGF